MRVGRFAVGAAVVAAAACGGVDEVVPPDAPADAAEIDAEPIADARTDAPDDGRAALPDITLVENLIMGTVRAQNQIFSADDCELLEGCIGAAGTRRLLRFSTVTANVGAGDLYFGPPESNPAFEYSVCHGHFHLAGYATYELVDGAGTVLTGHKQAFCLLDSIQIDPQRPGPYYTCANQGISAGWADSYPEFLPCQWIDITDVAPGVYTLRITVNPDQIFEETDYTNNVFELPVTF
jgi:hypothetical protein